MRSREQQPNRASGGAGGGGAPRRPPAPTQVRDRQCSRPERLLFPQPLARSGNGVDHERTLTRAQKRSRSGGTKADTSFTIKDIPSPAGDGGRGAGAASSALRTARPRPEGYESSVDFWLLKIGRLFLHLQETRGNQIL